MPPKTDSTQTKSHREIRSFSTITGMIRAYEREVKPGSYLYSTSIRNTERNGEITKVYLDIKFSKFAKEQLAGQDFVETANGGYYEFEIEHGFLTTSPAYEHGGKSYPAKVAIFVNKIWEDVK